MWRLSEQTEDMDKTPGEMSPITSLLCPLWLTKAARRGLTQRMDMIMNNSLREVSVSMVLKEQAVSRHLLKNLSLYVSAGNN